MMADDDESAGSSIARAEVDEMFARRDEVLVGLLQAAADPVKGKIHSWVDPKFAS